ncbi:TRAP transporter small permease subunit [Marinobacterium sp. LSUCC0821]|jgi:TRAP-type mannitol/chloroaromatic compound transport system permease small subunit|uniref:TRAP transporter small permease subunit n=1 Tax=Marinobacterium sp. LSUCC0821 TaxID=2668067 RepID=UPI0014516829|nr:TRAP transporter small permease subunit [Marinobacterium sp. LSUCC0821]QJD70990.1 TRAP transporter small permease subunit [Marinobacterium sp. LSUCC0821]
MLSFIRFADNLSAWVGKSFAWLIIVMAFGVGYEVFVRYVLNSPTSWALDVSFIMYGTLFMMGGAYTLSKNGHVRGDFIYRTWKPTTQAKVDLTLYILFFFPGVLALILSGWKYASRSWGYGEVSVNSPAGIPIYQFKMVMVAAGILLLIQGIAQVMRCIYCIKNGNWLNAEDDIEETEVILMRAAENSEDLSSIKDR